MAISIQTGNVLCRPRLRSSRNKQKLSGAYLTSTNTKETARSWMDTDVNYPAIYILPKSTVCGRDANCRSERRLASWKCAFCLRVRSANSPDMSVCIQA
eukprot:scaffold63297_cov22-Prasinocladus_malaysianus.AAC.2